MPIPPHTKEQLLALRQAIGQTSLAEDLQTVARASEMLRLFDALDAAELRASKLESELMAIHRIATREDSTGISVLRLRLGDIATLTTKALES